MATKPPTCSVHLQELGREQDPEVPAPSDGQEGCDLQALVSPVFFNAWRKSRFLHFVPSYSTGSPLLRADSKA